MARLIGRHPSMTGSALWLAVMLCGCSRPPREAAQKGTLGESLTKDLAPMVDGEASARAAVACGGLGALGLDKAVSLLGGRAAVRLPRQMMPADPATKVFWASNEDVLEMKLGELNITFRIEETYQTRSKGMPRDGETLAIVQQTEPEKAEIKTATLKNGSEAVLWLRKAADPTYGALYFFDKQGVMMVASLLAGTHFADETVDLECGPAFERILSTVLPGEVPLDLESKQRRLMNRPVPKGRFFYRVNHGDTVIEYAGVPAPVGTPPPLVGVYKGVHPQPIDEERASEVIEGRSLMGQPARWFVRVRKPDHTGRHIQRADAQRNEADGRSRIHGFALADSREAILELMALLE